MTVARITGARMTAQKIRKALRKMLEREEAAYRQHKLAMGKTGRGDCLSTCEDATRRRIAHEIIVEALRAAGARISKEEA